MDVELILDAAEKGPGLCDLARGFLETEAVRLGVPLDEVSILAWRAEVHVTGAADEFVRHLAS